MEQFFIQHRKLALALSGGVDSAYLLCEALHYGVEVRAYFVKSVFQPEFELRDAERLVKDWGGSLTVIPVDILACGEVCQNSPERCYFCKLHMFKSIIERAQKDGFDTIIEGTNASDSVADRPGMKALQELGILSPLRLCGLTKSAIRERSRQLGLFTWNKPAYACLATRIPTGMGITANILDKVERAEKFLLEQGFEDLRVRLIDEDTAKIQILKGQFEQFFAKRNSILKEMKVYFNSVLLDLEGRCERRT